MMHKVTQRPFYVYDIFRRSKHLKYLQFVSAIKITAYFKHHKVVFVNFSSN